MRIPKHIVKKIIRVKYVTQHTLDGLNRKHESDFFTSKQHILERVHFALGYLRQFYETK